MAENAGDPERKSTTTSSFGAQLTVWMASATTHATSFWNALSRRYGRGRLVLVVVAMLGVVVIVLSLSLRGTSPQTSAAALPAAPTDAAISTSSPPVVANAAAPSSPSDHRNEISTPIPTANVAVSADVQRKIDLLDHGTFLEKMRASEELGQLRVTAAVPALGKLLGDEDSRLRETCTLALENIASDDASLALLADAMRQSEDSKSSDALVRLGRPAHLIKLIEVHPLLRAIRKLGELKSKEAVPSLKKLVQTNESSDVRNSAMWALASIGDPSAAEAIIPLTRNEIEAEDATKVLRQLKSPQSFDRLCEMTQRGGPNQDEAILALGELGDKRAFDVLVAARNEFHGTAEVALGQLGDQRALPLLIASANGRGDRGGESERRAGAATGLGLLKDASAVQPLIDLLAWDLKSNGNAATQLAAINTLRGLKNNQALDVLKTATQSGNRDVRVAALAAIEAINK